MSIGGSNPAAELAKLAPPTHAAAPIDRAEHFVRLERARAATERVGADALLVNAGASLRYFTGIPWSASERMVALLLPVSGEPRVICPTFERGTLEADLTIPAELLLWEEDESPIALVADAVGPGATIAVDPLLPFSWGERLRGAGLSPVDGSTVIDRCRIVKSEAELALLAQAKAMTLDVHRAAAGILRPGIAASEVVRFIDAAHRAVGASGSGFCIVQFGRATAFPHGLPGEQYLAEGYLVLIDTGCLVCQSVPKRGPPSGSFTFAS